MKPYPSAGQYNRAIRRPGSTLKVADDQLLTGSVEMRRWDTPGGSYLEPLSWPGQFAIVYKFRKKSGGYVALRCLLAQMATDTCDTYRTLSSTMLALLPEVTVRFTYHDPGISVPFDDATMPYNVRWEIFPLIEMDFVEGDTLIAILESLCRSRDVQGIADLFSKWIEVVEILEDRGVAHGDLSGRNVMVRRQTGDIVLVDYDSIYMPSMSATGPAIGGTPGYQRADHLSGTCTRLKNSAMDRFSVLVITTAILALGPGQNYGTSMVIMM